MICQDLTSWLVCQVQLVIASATCCLPIKIVGFSRHKTNWESLARRRRCFRDFLVIFLRVEVCLKSVFSDGQDVKYDRDIIPHPHLFHRWCVRCLLITESSKTPGHYRYLMWVLVYTPYTGLAVFSFAIWRVPVYTAISIPCEFVFSTLKSRSCGQLTNFCLLRGLEG